MVVEGDTLRGEIVVGTETEAARGARFQGPGASALRDVDVEEASAFGEIEGREYRRGRFPTEASPPEGAPLPRLGFARVVRDGTADLLSYEPVARQPVLLLQLDGETTGLFVVERVAEVSTGLRLQTAAPFRQILLGRLGSCGVEEGDVADLSLTEADVVPVIDGYNVCQDASYAPDAIARSAATRRPIMVAIEVGAGLTTSSFQRATGVPTSFDDPTQSSPSSPGCRRGLARRRPTRLLRRRPASRPTWRSSAIRLPDRPSTARSSPAMPSPYRWALGVTVDAAETPGFVGVGVLGGVTRRRHHP